MPETQSQPGDQKKRTTRFVHLIEGGVLLVMFFLVFGPSLRHELTNLTRNSETRIRMRDEQRLHDLALMQSAILQYRIERGYYPASKLVTPYIDRSNAGEGIWLGDLTSADLPYDQLLGRKLNFVPRDPINTGVYVYSYKSSRPPADSYELNIRLENDTAGLMARDGGDNDQQYEVGNDLGLIK